MHGPDGIATSLQRALASPGSVVRSKTGIAGILEALRASRELVAVHAGRSGEFVVTVVLAVDAAREVLLVDGAPDSETHGHLASAGPLLVQGHLGGLRVQFRVDGTEAVGFDGRPALRMPFPEAIESVERRDSFRVRIPRSRLVLCEWNSEPDRGSASARVRDLSCGGASLQPVDALALEAGSSTPRCRLILDDEGALEIGIEVRRVGEIGAFSGIPERIVGARFVGLSAATEMRISRYLLRLQREARRAGAFGELAARVRSEGS